MNQCRGMTLLEVLVALAIFALAGLTVVQTVTQQMSGLADLEEKNGRQFFRITSRAVGPGGAIATLQTYISVMAQKQE